LVVTKQRSGAQPARQHQLGLGGSGVAGQGRGSARVTGAAPVGVGRDVTRAAPAGARQCDSGQGVAGAAARGDLAAAARMERCEREKREKERAGPGTIPAYVHRADTSADDHKRVGLRGSRGALCPSATRRT
jgi:hypothetical protein